MPTTYKELYSSIYSKITDYDLSEMTEDEADEILHEYIRPAAAAFECCTQELSDRDEENKCFNFTLTDVNFEILVNFMLINYLDAAYIKTPLMLKAHMSSSDFHKFDNKDTLAKVMELRQILLSENRQLMINHSLRKEPELKELYKKKRKN